MRNYKIDTMVSMSSVVKNNFHDIQEKQESAILLHANLSIKNDQILGTNDTYSVSVVID